MDLRKGEGGEGKNASLIASDTSPADSPTKAWRSNELSTASSATGCAAIIASTYNDCIEMS